MTILLLIRFLLRKQSRIQILRDYKYLFLVLIAMFTSFSATPQVTADFTTITSTTGCGSLVVEFKDLSLGSPTTWLWDFGNGNTSNLKDPISIYNTPGVYDVILQVNDGVSTDIKTVSSYIHVHQEPIAALQLNSAVSGCAPLNVSFENLTSTNTSIVSWQWDFGDGGSSNLQHPIYTYLTDGLYSVSLSAIDINGCQSLVTEIDLLEVNVLPVAEFTTDISFSCDTLQQVLFFNNSLSSSSFLWDFGDGNTSNLLAPSHLFNTGIFSVTLYASQGNCIDTLVMTDLIEVVGSLSADFTTNINSGCEGLSVSFDLDDNNANTFSWDFGDGQTSILQNPTHIFDAAGVYDINLLTSVSGQCSTSVTALAEIEVFAKPIISFSADQNLGCSIPFDIAFSDITTGATHWIWDFGDGNFSNIQNPLNTYTTVGVFDVSLFTENNNGCTSSVIFPAYIEVNNLPVVNIDATPIFSCVGEDISFVDLSSTGITDWDWHFGDDSISNNQNPIHQYNAPGLYDVSLIAGINGCKDTLVIFDYIEIIIPAAVFQETYNCDDPLRVEFENLSIGADNVFWDFGDGNTSSLLNPIHTFSNFGLHTVSLSVTNSVTGCTHILSKEIRLTDPIADFDYLLNINNSYQDSVGCIPKRVYLEQKSQDWSHYQVLWSDGYIGYGRTDHLFTNEGIFDVSMIVTDLHGCKDTATIENMYHMFDVAVDFGISDVLGCDSMLVEFADLSNHPFSSVEWNFGDGGSSFLNNPQHIYYTEGVYDVTLYTKSIYGCKDTIKKLEYVHYQPPSASFLSNIQGICVGDQVEFMNLSTGVVITSSWDFGDNDSSNLLHPVHEFGSNGLYDINLLITDSFGCSDNLSLNNHIEVLSPIADFSSLALSSNCPPLISDFTNLSSSDASIFQWNFGDGSISSIEDPSHLFSGSGLFDICLIVENSFGCRDTLVRDSYVNMLGVMPAGNFIISDTLICKNDSILFIPTVYNVDNFLWDFGDGEVSSDSVPTAIYSDAGIFIPSLIIENGSGCQLTLTSDYEIRVNEVIVDAGIDLEICEGELAELNAVGNGLFVNWTPPNALSSISINNPQANPVESRLYYVSHTDGMCEAVDSIFVTVHNDVPSATFSAANFCDGDLTSFEANSGLMTSNNSYIWSFGDTGKVVSSVLNIGNNNITLIIENLNNSCKDILNQNIVIYPNPVADFLASDVCLGDSVHFTDNSSSNTMIWAYDFGDGIGFSADQNPSHSYASAGLYNVTLTLTSDMYCRDIIMKDIVVNEIPVANFTIENHCEGYGNIFRDISSVVDSDIDLVEYNFNDGYTSTDSIVSHIFDGYGLFDVLLTVTSTVGCSNSKVKTAEVFANPVIEFTSSESCQGDQTIFNNFSFTPNGNIISYKWDFGLEGFSFARSPAHTFSSSGVFDVDLSIVSDRGCEAVLSQEIIVHEIPSANFEVISDVCLGDKLKISYLPGVNEANVATWRYSLGDGSFSNKKDPIHAYNYESTFDVGLVVVSSEGCKNDTMMQAAIKAHNYPVADFQANTFFVSELYPEISFYNYSVGGETFEWDFDNGESSFEENPSITFKEPRIYNVVFNVSNSIGCSSEMIKTVQINPEYTFFIPDAFTPNGDGVNDIFVPQGNRILSFQMQVFDRWGAVVFESSNIDSGWDGKNFLGEALRNGIYLYHIALYDLNERLWVYNGELNLMR